MVNKILQLEITQIESQLAAIHSNLQSALVSPRGRRSKHAKDEVAEDNNEEQKRKPRARSQPPLRTTKENVRIISISEENENEDVGRKTSFKPSCVSTILVNNGRNRMQGAKPAIPEKPKDIGLAMRTILKKKERVQIKEQLVRKDKERHTLTPIQIRKRERRFSQDENPSNLVLNIQFEILKLISEKEDLIKENEVLKHYRQSYMKLQEENSQLREKIELLQVVPSPNTEQGMPQTRILFNRTSPDGQEHTEENLEKLIRAIM